MIPITVTLRSLGNKFAPHQAEALVPYLQCPLAVTNVVDVGKRIGWRARPDQWCITHRPSGFMLGTAGNVVFLDVSEAERVLNACNPTFPAWLMATGAADDPATTACKAFFRVACAANGVEWDEDAQNS